MNIYQQGGGFFHFTSYKAELSWTLDLASLTSSKTLITAPPVTWSRAELSPSPNYLSQYYVEIVIVELYHCQCYNWLQIFLIYYQIRKIKILIWKLLGFR